jgi:hypothetical protein
MDVTRRATIGLAVLAFLIPATVYLITLTPTVPFWDAGEFIAVSYILGVPHPPGTPLFVLLGRVATLIPWATVAQRVNALSAIPSAIAVMFTYLTGLILIRLAFGRERTRTQDWIAQAGAFTGALMFAFSNSFWENSIEAEVYALMSLAQIIVLWLGLRWWEEHERRPASGPLLLCAYVMWLCVGLHLGVGVMGLPLILLVWLVDRRVALVFAMPFLTVLLVTMGLERMAGGMCLLSAVVFLVFAWQKKMNAWAAVAGAVVALFLIPVAFGDEPFTRPTALLAVGSVVVPLAFLARRSREGRIIALALFLMVAGYSTHVYLPIRAAQHPAINEGDPSTWDSLRDLLERKQYGQMDMFVRRAPWSVQLDKEFWRYFQQQWPLFPAADLKSVVPRPGAPGALQPLVERVAAVPWGALVPLVLGAMGGVWQSRRNRISFLYTGCFLGISTAGMIVFLNFTDHEVRNRDYFFQSGYHAYSLWIGLGVAWFINWVRESFAAEQQAAATVVAGALLLSQPLWLASNLWYAHDRRGNYVAHDYACNMLEPLEPNSFVFTNGDNDTFPLWYVQQVEGVRKDVRVVNLSLLNTDWYIRQLRDEEPKVPIRLGDDEIKALGRGAVQDSAGNIIYTNEFMVHHIMSVNRADGGWKKQPYFAVTVPEHMGLEKHFSLEALVYRVSPDTVQESVDVPATRRALYETFKYRGLFTPDGSWDASVYKDDNASILSRNYAAAHLQLAFWYRRKGDLAGGIQEMERVARMFPDYTEVLIPLGTFYLDNRDTAKARELFERLARQDARNPEAHYYYGVTLYYLKQVEPAVREFETAILLDPDYSMAYYAAFSALSETGQGERALAYLERWVNVHPEDAQARQMLEAQRTLMGRGPGPSRLVPRPPLPSLP